MNGVSGPATDDTVKRKQEFVRAQGFDITAEEVVDKAAKEGIEVDQKYVWNQRTIMRKEKNSGPSVKKAKGRAPSEETMFIRSQALGVSVDAVVSRAEVKGLTITPSQVWKVRNTMKAKGEKKKTKTKYHGATAAGTSAGAAAARQIRKSKQVVKEETMPMPSILRMSSGFTNPVQSQATEEFLKLIASEIGLSKSIEIIQAMKTRLQHLVHGGT